MAPYKAPKCGAHPCNIPINETNEKLPYGALWSPYGALWSLMEKNNITIRTPMLSKETTGLTAPISLNS